MEHLLRTVTVIQRENLIEELRDLADLGFQLEVWQGLRPGVMSSFAEVVCGVFDDSGLGDLLEDPQAARLKLGERATEAAPGLSNAVDQVDAERSVEELVTSSEMERVRTLARRLCGLLIQGGSE